MSKRLTAFSSWLDKQLGMLNPGDRLPDARRLAEKFNIAHKTVKRILSEYGAEGKLERIRGKGTFIPGVRPHVPIPLKRSSAEQLAESIKHSIAIGDLRASQPLPSIKYMQLQMKVGSATVAEAYERLVREKHAVKIGRAWYVGAMKQRLYLDERRQVLLFHPSVENIGKHFADDHLAPAYLAMEHELVRLGYYLRFCDVRQLESFIRSWRAESIVPDGIVLYRFTSPLLEQTAPSLVGFCKNALRLSGRRPPILLDLSPGRRLQIPNEFSLIHRAAVSTEITRATADYLIRRRYTTPAFFVDERATSESPAWFFARAVKLANRLLSAGSDIPVRFVVKSQKPKSTVAQFWAREMARAGPRLQDIVEETGLASPQAIQERVRLCDAIEDAFEQQKDCDIWVFASITDAHAAAAWCRSHRVAVPERTSILSMESDPAYCPDAISTCELDWSDVGYLMAHHIVGDLPPLTREPRNTFLNARVYVRLTSR